VPAVVLLAAAGLAPARAQQAGAGAVAVANVRGLVYDSLARAPLAGAHVWVDGGGRSAVTDARGRYRLDSVPLGSRRILFSHPELDSIGIPQLGRRVSLTAAPTPATADLGVPSLATLRRSLCGADSGRAGRGGAAGIVFGTVTDATSRARLVGARVEASWVALDWEPGERMVVSRPRRELRSDSLGNYYVCGAPLGETMTVTAAAGAFVTGRVELILGPRGVARRDLTVSFDTLAPAFDTVTNLRAGRAAIVGMVRDESGAPLRGVQAVVDDAAGDGLTDTRGRFVLLGMPGGTQMLMVRRVGYGAVRMALDLRPGDTVEVAVSLRALTILDTITVTASRHSVIAEMAERLRGGTGGYSLVGDQVRSQALITSVLSQLPSINIEGSPTAFQVLGRAAAGGYCAVNVWLDGVRGDAELLRTLRPAQVIAVEWYPRGAQAPFRFQPQNACAVLLVWTSDALSPLSRARAATRP
jgi:hypothetical protein